MQQIEKGMMRWKIIGRPRTNENFMQHRVFYCTKIKSNKQSAKVICRFNRLRTSYSKRHKGDTRIENLSAAHAFNNSAQS